jgi:hypothetical protein
MLLPVNTTIALAGLASRAFNLADHPFVAAGEGDHRSPCPALNSLANHGFINHNGQGILSTDLSAALSEVYHTSLPINTVLLTGGVALSHINLFDVDLAQLGLHNGIEHDASLGHADANGAEFAPTVPDTARIDEFLAQNPDGITVETLAKRRVELEGATPLDNIHDTIAKGEGALTVLIMGDTGGQDGTVSTDRFRTWFGGEQLPADYQVPTAEVGLFEVKGLADKLGDLMKAEREAK